MKKFLLVAAVAASAMSANAQVWLGGKIGLMHNSKADVTNVTLAPEFGFALNNRWTLASELYFTLNEKAVHGLDYTSYGFNPYARYKATTWGPVSLVFDNGVELGWDKVENADAAFTWGIGIKPALEVNLTKNVTFVTSLGRVGYTDSDLMGESFGFDFSSKNVQVGVYYNF